MLETQARPPHQNRVSSHLAYPWGTRLIATLGIMLMTIGLYVPSASRDVIVHGDPVSRFTETWVIWKTSIPWILQHVAHMERLSFVMQLMVDALYSVLVLGGLGLIPLLWFARAKEAVWVRWTYTFWLVVLVLVALASLPSWWQFSSQTIPGPSAHMMSLGSSSLLPGAVVFPLGVLTGGAALVLLLREPVTTVVTVPAQRTRWQRIAILLLTAGTIVWSIGFYLMPEVVTAACPPVSFSVTQFAYGACAGLDSDQVLQAAYNAGSLNPITHLLYILGRNFELLVAAGCLTALGGWTRRLSAKSLAWLAAWPALAFGVALVALQGARVIAQQGFRLTVATGDNWHVASGMIVTFVGIGLVMLGQCALWRELARYKRTMKSQ